MPRYAGPAGGRFPARTGGLALYPFGRSSSSKGAYARSDSKSISRWQSSTGAPNAPRSNALGDRLPQQGHGPVPVAEERNDQRPPVGAAAKGNGATGCLRGPFEHMAATRGRL